MGAKASLSLLVIVSVLSFVASSPPWAHPRARCFSEDSFSSATNKYKALTYFCQKRTPPSELTPARLSQGQNSLCRPVKSYGTPC